MSADNFDSRFPVSSDIFRRVNHERVLKLIDNPIMELKILTVRISDIIHGVNIYLPSEFQGETGENRLYSVFVSLIDKNRKILGYRGNDIASKLCDKSSFEDSDLVEEFGTILYLKLMDEQESWTDHEIFCAHSIAAGFFEIEDLQ